MDPFRFTNVGLPTVVPCDVVHFLSGRVLSLRSKSQISEMQLNVKEKASKISKWTLS